MPSRSSARLVRIRYSALARRMATMTADIARAVRVLRLLKRRVMENPARSPAPPRKRAEATGLFARWGDDTTRSRRDKRADALEWPDQGDRMSEREQELRRR